VLACGSEVVEGEEHMSAELHDGHRYENDLCMRVSFREGRIAAIFEYYGQHAHARLVESIGAVTAR
jgi:ketosteroid isomerase-like protein